MKFNCSISINKKREEVITLFQDRQQHPKWHKGLMGHECINGHAWEEGSQHHLPFKMGRTAFTLLETVLENNLPDHILLDVDTLGKGIHNSMNNRFIDLGDGRCQYEVEIIYTFSSFPMKMMGKLFPFLFKKQVQEMLSRFKNVAEQ